MSYTEFPRLFPEEKVAWRMRSLQKLEKLRSEQTRLHGVADRRHRPRLVGALAAQATLPTTRASRRL